MKTVWKFPLPLAPEVNVMMPEGAQVLYVGNQAGTIALWALVDPDKSLVTRVFRIAGTGHDVPDGVYVGTVQQGPLVWHVFEPYGSI